eukprot:gene14624-20657_t
MNIGSLFGRSIQKSPYQKVLEQMLAEQANDDVANVATESKYFRLYGEKVGCSPAILCAIDCMYAVVQQEAKRSTDALDAMFGEARLMQLEEQELVLERVDTSYVRGDVITATKCKHAEDTDEIKRALQLFVGSGRVPAQLMPRVLPLLPPVDYIAPSEYRSQESPSDDLCLRMDPQP